LKFENSINNHTKKQGYVFCVYRNIKDINGSGDPEAAVKNQSLMRYRVIKRTMHWIRQFLQAGLILFIHWIPNAFYIKEEVFSPMFH
jgi:hypothetical protein